MLNGRGTYSYHIAQIIQLRLVVHSGGADVVLGLLTVTS